MRQRTISVLRDFQVGHEGHFLFPGFPALMIAKIFVINPKIVGELQISLGDHGTTGGNNGTVVIIDMTPVYVLYSSSLSFYIW
jgi:hypothetical protein